MEGWMDCAIKVRVVAKSLRRAFHATGAMSGGRPRNLTTVLATSFREWTN